MLPVLIGTWTKQPGAMHVDGENFHWIVLST